ncbi:MAG: 5-(carboxyamino)imidazole ribonucleotide synthase [Planctomycetota bacterium]
MPSDPLVAILGGGQLGRMLALAGAPLGVRCRVLDPLRGCSAGQVTEHVVGGYTDPQALARLADGADVVTYEWENVPVDSARALEGRLPVHPSCAALETAQDRLHERELFERLGIATPEWRAVDRPADLPGAIEAVGTPALLKARRGGYDGKGQVPIESPGDAERAWAALANDEGDVPGGAVLDAFVAFERELSVLGVRSTTGETGFYPLVQNTHRGGILRLSRAPARGVRDADVRTACDAAAAIMDELDYAGVLAVEFFDTGPGAGAGSSSRLIANEIAPRVHNSGHWTIEGAVTSQFENHLRAILGLPLGSCAARGHSAMVNAIGDLPRRAGVLAVPGAAMHVYGKDPRPGRKVGHVTITASEADELDALLERYTRVVG